MKWVTMIDLLIRIHCAMNFFIFSIVNCLKKKTRKFVFKMINFIITLVWKYVYTLIFCINFVIWQVTWYIVFSVPKSFIVFVFSLYHLIVIENSSYWRYRWIYSSPSLHEMMTTWKVTILLTNVTCYTKGTFNCILYAVSILLNSTACIRYFDTS